MRRTAVRTACLTALGFLLLPVILGLRLAVAEAAAKKEVFSPNIILPDGAPGFHLLGTTGGATGAPINPGVLVGLNPQPLPPFPNPFDSRLDLTDPINPVVSNAGRGNSFSIFWGIMSPGGAVSFRPPNPPDPQGFSSFLARDDSGNTFDFMFQVVGPGPVDPASWVSLNPQPLPPKDFQSFQINFSFQTFSDTTGDLLALATLTDPELTFNVTANGNPVSFSIVPEPPTLTLLAAGMLGLAAWRRARAPSP